MPCNIRVYRKKGASWLMTLDYAIDGVFQDLTAIDIAAAVYDQLGVKLADLIVDKQDQNVEETKGVYTIRLAGVIDFEPGEYLWDITYTFGGSLIDKLPEDGFCKLIVSA